MRYGQRVRYGRRRGVTTVVAALTIGGLGLALGGCSISDTAPTAGNPSAALRTAEGTLAQIAPSGDPELDEAAVEIDALSAELETLGAAADSADGADSMQGQSGEVGQ